MLFSRRRTTFPIFAKGGTLLRYRSRCKDDSTAIKRLEQSRGKFILEIFFEIYNMCSQAQL